MTDWVKIRKILPNLNMIVPWSKKENRIMFLLWYRFIMRHMFTRIKTNVFLLIKRNIVYRYICVTKYILLFYESVDWNGVVYLHIWMRFRTKNTHYIYIAWTFICRGNQNFCWAPIFRGEFWISARFRMYL